MADIDLITPIRFPERRYARPVSDPHVCCGRLTHLRSIILRHDQYQGGRRRQVERFVKVTKWQCDVREDHHGEWADAYEPPRKEIILEAPEGYKIRWQVIDTRFGTPVALNDSQEEALAWAVEKGHKQFSITAEYVMIDQSGSFGKSRRD